MASFLRRSLAGLGAAAMIAGANPLTSPTPALASTPPSPPAQQQYTNGSLLLHGPDGIYLADPNGERLRRISDDDWGHFTPNGNLWLWKRTPAGDCVFTVARPDGSDPRVLDEHAACWGPGYTGPGGELYSNAVDRTLWFAAEDSSQSVKVFDQPRSVVSVWGSPDNTHFVVEAEWGIRPDHQLWLVDRYGTQQTLVDSIPGEWRQLWITASVSWSPDNSHFAYSIETHNYSGEGSADIGIGGTDGHSTRLAHNDTITQQPFKWSVDGTHLAYSETTLASPERRSRLVVVDSNGMNPTVVESITAPTSSQLLPAIQGFNWAPTGSTRIAYTTLHPADTGPSRDLSVMVGAADGTSKTAIEVRASDVDETLGVHWSPSGAFLDYVFCNQQVCQAVVARPTGEMVKRVEDSDGVEWSPTRDVLDYDGPLNGPGYALHVFDPSNGRDSAIGTGGRSGPLWVWAPTGTTLVHSDFTDSEQSVSAFDTNSWSDHPLQDHWVLADPSSGPDDLGTFFSPDGRLFARPVMRWPQHLWITRVDRLDGGGSVQPAPAGFAFLDWQRLPAQQAVGSRFVAVTPQRLLDTRVGMGHYGPAVAQATLTLPVAGAPDSPVPADATAVVLNVTGTEVTSPTYLTVHRSGSPPPTTSNLNLLPGETHPNLVTAKIGTGGSIDIFNAAGTTHVIADVVGYYTATDPTAGGYRPIEPRRILDTRDGTGTTQSPVGQHESRDIKVTGAETGVPDDATAVVFNLTGTAPTDATYITAWPAGSPLPVTSNLNLAPGETRPNLVTVKVGDAGKVSLFNAAGRTHLIADIAGYYTADDPDASEFVAVDPYRIHDSRTVAQALGTDTDIAVWPDSFGTVPPDARAVAMNATITNPTAATYETVYPRGTQRPNTSNLNALPGQTIPNMVISDLSDTGAFNAYNAAGTTDLIFDVAGYFRPPQH